MRVDLAVFTVLVPLVPLIKRLRATAPKVDLRVRSLDSTRVHSRSGAATTKVGRSRFASPRTASMRSTSRVRRLPLPRRPAPGRMLSREKPKYLLRPSLPANRLPLRRKRALGSSITPVKPRARVPRARKAHGSAAVQARNKLACSRCWAERRERRLPPSCGRPIGSSTRSEASLPAWCARSSISICARRKPTGTKSIVSSTAAAHVPIPAVRVVARLERHGTRTDRSGGAG